jgi:16S rRNA (adenine1518-N6/adenine1519-N6)-dimethyltransferase
MNVDKEEEKQFFRLAKTGFSQKRKQLQKNLRQLGYDKAIIAKVLEEAGVNGRRRAETLSLNEWNRLSTALNKSK